MSSPVYIISEDDDSFDPLTAQKLPINFETVLISDDEENMAHKTGDIKIKRQQLIKNLFPSQSSDKSGSSKTAVLKSALSGREGQPDCIKMIGSVKVHLPVKPYPCQVAVMFKVITAIGKNQNCLLESPTGTGKTLALLCSALAWQKKERELISQKQAQLCHAEYPELNQLDGAVEYISSPNKVTLETPEEFFSKKIHGEKSIYDTPQKGNTSKSGNVVNKRQERYDSTDDDSPTDGLVKLQKKMRFNNSNSPSPELQSTPEKLITSNVETPKKIRDLYELVDNLRLRTSMFVDSSLPTIYYGARTHKQIQQVVKEFQRTSYCGEAMMTILSSRDHSCIREFDRSQWASKNDMCRACVKTLPPLATLNESNQGSNCKYYDNRKALNRKTLPSAFDLKDLVKIGSNLSACPYFGARELARNANIIFCPYNYLIEPGIRRSMQINLEDNIVIIDEGHNIENICRDAATFNFTRDEITSAMKELETVCSFRFANQNIITHIEYLLKTLKEWDQWFENQTPLINNQAVNDMEAVFTWEVNNFVHTLNNHNIGQKQYNDFHENTEIFNRKLRDDPRTLVGVTQSTGTLLESLDTAFGFLFRCSSLYLDDFQPVLVRRIRSEVNNPEAWRTSQFNKLVDNEPLTLRLICLNPAVVFEGLKQARCIILASGTLTPQITLQSELATDFPLTLSTKHNIPSDRVWIGSLSNGPNGSQLDCTYRGINLPDVQDSLGEAVLHVCRVTPHGVLCFLPSYRLMNTLSRRWRQKGLWQQMEEKKHIFMESTDTSTHDNNMEDYYECVGSGKGALLFAVYRGKVAEGMDFKDRQARAVITVGIPYPYNKDIAVMGKMRYNDKYNKARNLLCGNDWYTIQAYRALNQAVGRCVRHCNDWGAVLLLDARFRNPSNTQYLSEWVKTKLNCNQYTFDSLVNGSNSLKSFMEDMTRRESEEQ